MDANTRSLIERLMSAIDCVAECIDNGGHADACEWSPTNAEARYPEVCQFCADLLTAEEFAAEARRLIEEG